MRQVKSEEVDLALDATDDANGFTKVCLSMSWRCASGTNISCVRCRQLAI
jgi:hypothetical protein